MPGPDEFDEATKLVTEAFDVLADETTKLIVEAFDAKFIGYLDESGDSLP
jgi:hypothetical protein